MSSQPANTGQRSAASGVRRVRMRTSGATLERLADGTMRLRPEESLKPYPKVLTDRLAHWAKLTPEKTCIARRAPDGEWRRITYAQAMRSIESIRQALLDRGLPAERPLAILSENDLEQFLLTMAGQHVGIPAAPISPAYSLVSKDFGKLKHTFKIITPGLVFASDGIRYAPAIEAVVGDHVEVITTTAKPDRRKSATFADLLETAPTPAVAEAHQKIDPDAPAKFLFTSGSTAMPKAVINT